MKKRESRSAFYLHKKFQERLSDIVCVTQSCKDADNLGALGFLAVTAADVNEVKDFIQHLRHRDIVLFLQNWEWAEGIGGILSEVAKSVKGVELPEKAVSDFIAAGGTKEQIEELIKNAVKWIPEEVTPKKSEDTEQAEPLKKPEDGTPLKDPHVPSAVSMNKRPSFQFYPADWLKDAPLQSCSLAAQGLWIKEMCVMHECRPYGGLSINGRPMKLSQIARLVGESEKTLLPLLKELEDAGVFSRDAAGIIYSRRMRRDEHVRNVRAEAGRQGGNPSLLKQMVNQEVKGEDKGGQGKLRKQKPTPSSSSSSASSKTKEYTPDFLSFWESYPRKEAKIKAFESWRSIAPLNGVFESLMAGLEKWKRTKQWQKDGVIPHPATWLNQRRWEDEIEEANDLGKEPRLGDHYRTL